ncbi:MAG TPA: MMPL family transporter [Baekduia sp.]|nr:MMPL family transporter [Baekduia sp.]
MLRLARLSIARPRIALALWAAVAIALALIGFGISDALSPSKTAVSGSESARAVHLANAEFGPSQLVPVLLEGPKAQLNRQGPALVRKLSAEKDIRVMSAWDNGPLAAELRPNPNAAMVIAAVAATDKQMFDGRQEQLDQLVSSTVKAPVKTYITGTPALERGLADASIDTTRTAILWALPILFVILLLLLRAPVAALVLTVFGGVTALAGFGVMALVGQVSDIAPLAVPYGALTGLAAGVGYALIIHRRWAEETASGASAREAATTAVDTSGRAVLIGGTALIVALLVAAAAGVTDVLVAEGAGVVICGLLAIGAAVVVMPAALIDIGARMRWLSFPAPRFATAAWDRLVGEEGFIVRRAVYTGAVATALLGVLAIPATKIEFGPPDPTKLPSDNKERIAYEEVGKVMGPGWVSPYNMVIVSKTRPITDPALLKQIAGLQTSIAKDKRVEVVAGPGSLAATSKQLSVLPKKLQESSKLLKTGPKDLAKLQAGLGLAGAGTQKLSSGLQQAAAGASKIQSGSGAAQSGAGQLKDGLATARAGAAAISTGLAQALDGAQQLKAGAGQALAGSEKITGGLGQAVQPVQEGLPIVRNMASDIAASSESVNGAKASADSVVSSLDNALAQLRALNDPNAAAAINSVEQARSTAGSVSSSLNDTSAKLGGASAVSSAFADQVAQLSSGLQQLYAGSSSLESGLSDLRNGNAQLVTGIGKLSAGGGSLTAGLSKLENGAGALESGLSQLTSGSGQLAGSLGAGVAPVITLRNGLLTMQSGVATFSKKLPSPKALDKLTQQSPGLFDNGYFVLAAVQGAPAAARNQASFAVNLAQGGNAGQIMIVPVAGPGTKANEALGEDLRDTADAFAAKTNTQVALGGQAAEFGDFESVGAEKFWNVVFLVAGVTALLLMLMLRTVILPLVSVAASLLTTAAALALLQVLYGGADPIIGLHGTFAPETLMGIFAVAFGFSTVFQVVLLERAREDFVATGNPHVALLAALRETAPAATGAAVVMVAVGIPFVLTDFLSVQQFAVGALAAIVLDAFLVRPVLLPAAMEVFGRAAWWPTRSPVAPAAPPARPTPTAGPPPARPTPAA